MKPLRSSNREAVIGWLRHYRELKGHLSETEAELAQGGILTASEVPELALIRKIVHSIETVYEKAEEPKKTIIAEFFFNNRSAKYVLSELYIGETPFYYHAGQAIKEVAALMGMTV